MVQKLGVDPGRAWGQRGGWGGVDLECKLGGNGQLGSPEGRVA